MRVVVDGESDQQGGVSLRPWRAANVPVGGPQRRYRHDRRHPIADAALYGDPDTGLVHWRALAASPAFRTVGGLAPWASAQLQIAGLAAARHQHAQSAKACR